MKRSLPVLLLCINSAAFAAGAFDGTWKTDLKSVQMTGKPDVYVLTKDEYVCSSCSPELRVKADGADHAVTGHPYYDTASAKITGPDSDLVVMKKGGKEFARYVDTVSADGKTLTTKWVNYIGEKELTGVNTEERVSPGPAGSHPISGSWRQTSFDANDALRTVTFTMTADGLQERWNGEGYDAKFDGKEYPMTGDAANTTVVLKKLSDTAVEETDHRGGKVVEKIRMTASKDGKKISVHDEDIAHGQTTTYMLVKQ